MENQIWIRMQGKCGFVLRFGKSSERRRTNYAAVGFVIFSNLLNEIFHHVKTVIINTFPKHLCGTMYIR